MQSLAHEFAMLFFVGFGSVLSLAGIRWGYEMIRKAMNGGDADA